MGCRRQRHRAEKATPDSTLHQTAGRGGAGRRGRWQPGARVAGALGPVRQRPLLGPSGPTHTEGGGGELVVGARPPGAPREGRIAPQRQVPPERLRKGQGRGRGGGEGSRGR